MQYRTGRVHVQPGSAAVSGTDTKWLYVQRVLNAIDPSHWVFKILGEPDIYTVSTITNDTTLTLSSVYGGSTELTDAEYLIHLDYTAFGYLPIVSVGDKDWSYIVRFAIDKFEDELTAPPALIKTRSVNFSPLTESPTASDGVIYYDASPGSEGFWYYDADASSWRKIRDSLLVEYV